MLCVYPELINQIQSIDRRINLYWHAGQKERHVENPRKQKACAGLPQRSGQIVVFTLVMHGMSSPQDRYFMTAAVIPVVTEIEGHERDKPVEETTRRKVKRASVNIEKCEVFEDPRKNYGGDQSCEITGCDTYGTGAETVDGIT